MPDGQDPLHDDVETTASTWIRPDDAIAQARDGLFSIIFPTRKTLEDLATFSSTAQVIASTVHKDVLAILPTVVISDGQARVVLPGEYENGSWRYKVETDRMAVVICFRSKTQLVLVTAWRKKK